MDRLNCDRARKALKIPARSEIGSQNSGAVGEKADHKELRTSLPSFVTKVGLKMDASAVARRLLMTIEDQVQQ